jgi:hypothetical protein
MIRLAFPNHNKRSSSVAVCKTRTLSAEIRPIPKSKTKANLQTHRKVVVGRGCAWLATVCSRHSPSLINISEPALGPHVAPPRDETSRILWMSKSDSGLRTDQNQSLRVLRGRQDSECRQFPSPGWPRAQPTDQRLHFAQHSILQSAEFGRPFQHG